MKDEGHYEAAHEPPAPAAAEAAAVPHAPHGPDNPHPTGPLGFTFYNRATFYWKMGLLLATTIALVPILLSQHEQAATWYLWALVVVHVAGIGIVAIGVRRHQIAPDRRGFWIRIVAIVCLVGLLYLASKGLRTEDGQIQASGWVFWGALFAIWALHTVGLLLLHLRGRREAKACPFV